MREVNTIDWIEWGHEAGRMMQDRNALWESRFGLSRAAYHWDMNEAEIRFARESDDIVASICLVGTTSVSEGSFLWAWANESIPLCARAGLDKVREFGAKHGLWMLTTPELQGGRPEALEALVMAGRVLDAEGVFTDDCGDVACFFALSGFRSMDRQERIS